MDRGSGSTNPWDYLDFELEIREGGPRDYPVTVHSPAGEAQAEMRFPFDEWELKDRLQALEIALLRSGGTRRRMPSPEEHNVQDFGRDLYEALLVGDVRTRYEVSLSEARRRNKGLRLKLRIRPPELAVLPWEFLYDAERDRYLCLSSTTPLVRHLDLPQPVEPLPVSPPLRVLGMVTSPSGLDPLDVDHEKRLVEEAIRGLREDGLLELTWLEGQTWRHLQRAMRRATWHVFHFVGHGGFDPATEEGAIALSDEAGHKRLLRATSLAELLDDHYPLRLVFLNSCEGARGSNSDAFSSTAASLVRRGIPAVVAMQYEITDKAAIEFSRDFYEAIADGLPVDAAVTEARAAVSMDSMLEWGTPVLYMRSPDGRIFDISTPLPGAQSTLETEDQQEEDLMRRYHESVKSAWADGELQANEVQRLKKLANDELRVDPGTAADIEREVMGDTIEVILERQEEAARQEQRNKGLEELYTQAGQFHRDRKWQAVIDVFDQIHSKNPDYPDPQGLLERAHEALERERRVAALYERGRSHVEAEEWQQALKPLEEIQWLKPGYRDTERLLSQARQELARTPQVEVPDPSDQVLITRNPALIRLAGLVAMLSGAAWMLHGLVVVVSGSPRGSMASGVFVGATFLALVGILALHILQKDNYGLIGRVGLWMVVVGSLALALALVLRFVPEVDDPLHLFLRVGDLLMRVGWVLSGVAILQARILPLRYGVGLIAVGSMYIALRLGGITTLLEPQSSTASWLTLGLDGLSGLLWLALGRLLWSGMGRTRSL